MLIFLWIMQKGKAQHFFKQKKMLSHSKISQRTKIVKLLRRSQAKKLICEYQDLSDDDLRVLAHSANLTQFEEISLQCNFITAVGLPHLKTMKYNNFVSINLGSNNISSGGLKVLSHLILPCLATLTLSKNKIDDAGLVHLSKCIWPNLTTLDLSLNFIGCFSSKPLLKAHLVHLEALNIANNLIQEITRVGVMAAEWRNIRFIKMSSQTSVSLQAEQKTSKRLANKFATIKPEDVLYFY